MTRPRRGRGEGSVYRRPDGLWTATLDLGILDGKRRRKVVYAKTKTEVVRKLDKAKTDRSTGHLSTSVPTFEWWAEYWLSEIAARRVKPKTIAAYRSHVANYIAPTLGRKRLDKITPGDVRAVHRKAEADGRSSTTAMHAHRVLSTMLRDAMKDGRITRNVAELVDQPAKAASTRRPFSMVEARAFFAQVDGDRLASRWQLAVTLGARQGECLGLLWECIDFTAGTIDLTWQLQRVAYTHGCQPPCGWRADRCPGRKVEIPARYERRHLEGNVYLMRPKTTGSVRRVALDPLWSSLEARRADYERERPSYAVDYGLVWCRTDGRPIDGREDYRAWQGHLAAAGIPPMPLHSARHSAASILGALGVSDNVVMSILGHSEITTTRGYQHVDLAQQRAAFGRMREALGLPPGVG